ncbi:MAG: hypothetical protein HZA31_03340 [Opitutae bacterium]|nr:hypothetical protein [Opitutae bacterium]
MPTSKLSFTLPDAPKHPPTHRIIDLCDYLAVKVLDPMFAQNDVKWNHRFENFFSFDNSCNPLEATGKIRLEVPPMLVGQMGQLEAATKKELARLKIKTAPFAYEGTTRGPAAKPVVVITVTENPTELIEPPEVNMSYTRGRVVLRDLLGYEKTDGRYEFDADDLLKRLAAVTDEKIAACTASPVRDTKSGKGVSRTPSPVSMQAVRRCLEELQRFAQWAKRHNFSRLAAS